MTALKKVEAKAVETVAPVSESAAIFSLIERVSADPSTPVERAEQLFSLYQRVQADQARKEFTQAFIAAQSEMEPVRRAADNPQTKSKYASFEALDTAIRPIYTKHGFGVSFSESESNLPDHVRVICHLLHVSGHERDYPLDVPADGKGAKGGDVMTKTHAVGSAISYGRRYTLGGAWNIVTTKDDDGNAAGGAADAPLTAEQVAELIALADDVGADKARFCKFYKINSFADILQSQFQKAKSALEAKRK